MIYFESPFAKVEWDEATNCVIVAFKGYAEGNNFREPLHKGVELLKLKKTSRWITDVRDMRVTKLEDQDWAAIEWHKEFIESGVQYPTVVVPTNVLGQMSMQRVMNKVKQHDDSLETTYFDNVDAAKDWLVAK